MHLGQILRIINCTRLTNVYWCTFDESSGVANFMSIYAMHTSRVFDGAHLTNIQLVYISMTLSGRTSLVMLLCSVLKPVLR
jgi:hypothetical protein